jgi:acyl carrier protein
MTDIDGIREIVLESLRAVLSETSGSENSEMSHVDEGTRLIGRTAVLDSLGLVNLILDIEQRVNEELGLGITIADERAMSREKSPFKTVESLSEYVFLLLEEVRRGVAP